MDCRHDHRCILIFSLKMRVWIVRDTISRASCYDLRQSYAPSAYDARDSYVDLNYFAQYLCFLSSLFCCCYWPIFWRAGGDSWAWGAVWMGFLVWMRAFFTVCLRVLGVRLGAPNNVYRRQRAQTWESVR
jgi:hypothetical protein